MLTLFKSQKKIIEQIHSEFDTAGDRLLQQAKDVISMNLSIPHKGKRLMDAGFVNSEKAISFKIKSDLLIENREQAELIEYYKKTYPFSKFITENELDRICKKYDLIHAPVSAYKKDVPEKNLKDIENVKKLIHSDLPTNTFFTKVIYGFTLVGISEARARAMGLTKKIYNFKATFFSHIDRKLKELHPELGGRSYICDRGEVHETNKQGLHICAPKSHFSLKKLGKKGKFGFFNITITEVKDPIVFRYVRGGVQIITKWGLEASDQSLVNDIDN